ncbi:DNA-3-methyladenine glycosylase I [Shigella flexneri]
MAYHDNEWACLKLTVKNCSKIIRLEGQQAGLSWITVLKNAKHRACFHQLIR